MPCMWIFRAGNMSRTVLRKARQRQVIFWLLWRIRQALSIRLIPYLTRTARCWGCSALPSGRKNLWDLSRIMRLERADIFPLWIQTALFCPTGNRSRSGNRPSMCFLFSAIWAGRIQGKSISMWIVNTSVPIKKWIRMTGFSTPWCPRGSWLQNHCSF